MLRIRPIAEEHATDTVKQVYADVKKTLDSPIVPLLFQYLANFEEYFVYLWSKMKTNIETPYFAAATQDAIHFTHTEISQIYSPSSFITQFMHTLHSTEKEHIQKTITDLQLVNAKLLILTIAMREGVKGVIIGQEQEMQLDAKAYEVDIFDIFHTKFVSENEIEPAAKMLAPLFGSQSLTISQYPTFFTHIATEMEHFVKQENYLWKRVELERFGMQEAIGLPYGIGCSYKEIITYAGHKPHLNELIYILAETFPSQFPRLLITTTVMQIALEGKLQMTKL